MNIMRLCLAILFCVALQGHVFATQNEAGDKVDSTTSKPTDSPGTSRSVEEYRNQIKEDQSQHGPYDPQLEEQLVGLGLQYKNQGDYKEAAKALDQALHIKRVNEGVENLSQLPVLEALIDVNKAAGNWEDLDHNYDLYLQVNQRNLASDDPSILSNIEKVARWKFLAYNHKLLKSKTEIQLNNLIKALRTTAKLIEEQHGKNDPHLIGTLNDLSLAHYLMLEDIQTRPLGEFQGDSSKDRFERVCRPVFTRQGMIMVCGLEQVPNPDYFYSRQTSKNMSVSNQANAISSLLNRIIKIVKSNPTLPPHDLALALVDVGDWYFLYNMHNAAISSYKNAFQLLMQDASGAGTLKKVFGRPTRIPSFTGYSGTYDALTAEENQPYVKLSFDVGTNGKAGNISVVEEAHTKNFMARTKAKAQVKSWIFRPRFENGKPVTTHDMVISLSGEMLKKDPARSSGPVSVTGSRIWR